MVGHSHSNNYSGKEYIPFSLCHAKSRQELKKGAWMQEPKQRSWRTAASWLALHVFISLLPYTTQDHLPDCSTIHNWLGSSTSISSQENAATDLAYKPTRWRHFVSCHSYLYSGYSLHCETLLFSFYSFLVSLLRDVYNLLLLLKKLRNISIILVFLGHFW